MRISVRRLWRRLAGQDGPGRTSPPLGEFFHPLPLAALVVLGLNDHLFKGAGWLPGWLTGKLSDFAGLLFFPLLLTAGGDTLWWLLRRGDWSLRRWKLALAIAVTAAGFAALKLSPAAAAAMDGVLGGMTVADPTDLLALASLGVAWWVGRAEIARVPLGRLELITRRGPRTAEAVAADLADVAALAGREPVARLAAACAAGEPGAIEEALAALRR